MPGTLLIRAVMWTQWRGQLT